MRKCTVAALVVASMVVVAFMMVVHGHDFHGGGFHGHSHVGIFLGAPFILGGLYDPYGYADPYGLYGGSTYSYYCRDPAGYYPDVQSCPGGWQQVLPDGSP